MDDNKKDVKKMRLKKMNNKNLDENIEKESISINESKKQKNNFNTIEVIVIMIITILVGVFIGSVVTYFKDNGTLKTSNKNLRELVSTYHDVVNNYYGEIDNDALLESGIKGMIDYLGDPYSSYLDSTSSAEFNEKLEGEYIGLGAEITKNDDGNLVVKTIFEDSPAKKCGLKVDDVIYKIDDTLVNTISLNKLTELIKGKEGSKATLYIKRNKEELSLEFIRGKVETASVFSEILEKDNKKIGLVTIEIFAKNSYKQFRDIIEDLQDQKIDALIVDVRDNNGGYLTTVKSISEMFLNKKDVIFIVEDKDNREKQVASKNAVIKIPTVLLINGGSASASEILAASLNENLNIDLIGTTTYGKGSVQKTKTLSSGATIKYTTQKWLTPSGKSIDGNGIKPTIEIEQSKDYYKDPTKDKDVQLQKAIEVVLKK